MFIKLFNCKIISGRRLHEISRLKKHFRNQRVWVNQSSLGIQSKWQSIKQTKWGYQTEYWLTKLKMAYALPTNLWQQRGCRRYAPEEKKHFTNIMQSWLLVNNTHSKLMIWSNDVTGENNFRLISRKKINVHGFFHGMSHSQLGFSTNPTAQFSIIFYAKNKCKDMWA